MSYNIYDKTTDTLKKVAGRVATMVLNSVSDVVDNASENVACGSLAVKPLMNYSTEEQVIGKWINGKPIYRKVIETTYPNVVTDGTQVTKYIDITDLNVDTVTFNYGILSQVGQFGFDGTGKLESWWADTTKLYIRGARLSSANKPLIFTLDYTKTTD